MSDAQSGIANNDVGNCGLFLNSDDTQPNGSSWVGVFWDAQSEAWRIVYNDDTGSAKSTPSGDAGAPIAQEFYARILRSGLDYYGYWSADGAVWMPLSKFTKGSAFTNVWLVAGSNAAFGAPSPIVGFDWIRLGGNGIDPS